MSDTKRKFRRKQKEPERPKKQYSDKELRRRAKVMRNWRLLQLKIILFLGSFFVSYFITNTMGIGIFDDVQSFATFLFYWIIFYIILRVIVGFFKFKTKQLYKKE